MGCSSEDLGPPALAFFTSLLGLPLSTNPNSAKPQWVWKNWTPAHGPWPRPHTQVPTPPLTLTLTLFPVLPATSSLPTFRDRVSSQLQSEFSDTLKGSHTGLRLFFTTCGPEKTGLGGTPRELGPREVWSP